MEFRYYGIEEKKNEKKIFVAVVFYIFDIHIYREFYAKINRYFFVCT